MSKYMNKSNARKRKQNLWLGPEFVIDEKVVFWTGRKRHLLIQKHRGLNEPYSSVYCTPSLAVWAKPCACAPVPCFF